MAKIKLILLTAIKAIIYLIFFFTLLVILGFAFGYNILDIFTSGYFRAFRHREFLAGFKYMDAFYPFIVLPFILTSLWIFRKLWIFIVKKFWQWFSRWFYYKKRFIYIINFLILCSLIVFSGWNINKIVKIHQSDCEEYLEIMKDLRKKGWYNTSGEHEKYCECISQKQGLKDRYLSLFFGDVIILLTGISISRLISKRQKLLNNKKNL